MNPERCMDQPDTPRRPCLQSGEFPAEPWHSTPRKKFPSPREVSRLQDVRSEQVARERDSMVGSEQVARERDSMVGLGQQRSEPQQRRHDCHLPHPTPTALQDRHGQLPHSTSLPLTLTQNGQMSSDEVENSGPQRRRRELQLLMAELRERDDELNKMAAAHHAQLLAWQQDRQRTLQLEEKCARLQEELVQQDEALRAVGRRAKASEEQEKRSQRERRAAQTQLQELMHTQRHDTLMQNQQEERIQALDSTVTMLSSQVGQLQAREEELSTMLKLKDKDVMEAIVHIQDLSARLRSLDDSRAEWQSRESKLLIEVETLKRNYRDIRHENSRLKGELQEKTLENSTQREELIRLKQEAELLRRDLAISGEEESWKDEMLQLCRSKQERTEAELHGLRRVCDSQHNDLQLLTLNLERSEEALREYEKAHLVESQRRGQRSRDSGLCTSAVDSNTRRSGQNRQTQTGTQAGSGHLHWATETAEQRRDDEQWPGGGATAEEYTARRSRVVQWKEEEEDIADDRERHEMGLLFRHSRSPSQMYFTNAPVESGALSPIDMVNSFFSSDLVALAVARSRLDASTDWRATSYPVSGSSSSDADGSDDENMQPRSTKMNIEIQSEVEHVSPRNTARGHFHSVPEVFPAHSATRSSQPCPTYPVGGSSSSDNDGSDDENIQTRGAKVIPGTQSDMKHVYHLETASGSLSSGSDDENVQPIGAKVNPGTQSEMGPLYPQDTVTSCETEGSGDDQPRWVKLNLETQSEMEHVPPRDIVNTVVSSLMISDQEVFPVQTITGGIQACTTYPVSDSSSNETESSDDDNIQPIGPMVNPGTQSHLGHVSSLETVMGHFSSLHVNSSLIGDLEIFSAQTTTGSIRTCTRYPVSEWTMQPMAPTVNPESKSDVGHVSSQETMRRCSLGAKVSPEKKSEMEHLYPRESVSGSSSSDTDGSEDDNIQTRGPTVSPETQPEMGHLSPREIVRGHFSSLPVNSSLISDLEVSSAQTTTGSSHPFMHYYVTGSLNSDTEGIGDESIQPRGPTVNPETQSDVGHVSSHETARRRSLGTKVNPATKSEMEHLYPGKSVSGSSISDIEGSDNENMQPRGPTLNPETRSDVGHMSSRETVNGSLSSDTEGSDDDNMHPIWPKGNSEIQSDILAHVSSQETVRRRSLVSDPEVFPSQSTSGLSQPCIAVPLLPSIHEHSTTGQVNSGAQVERGQVNIVEEKERHDDDNIQVNPESLSDILRYVSSQETVRRRSLVSDPEVFPSQSTSGLSQPCIVVPLLPSIDEHSTAGQVSNSARVEMEQVNSCAQVEMGQVSIVEEKERPEMVPQHGVTPASTQALVNDTSVEHAQDERRTSSETVSSPNSSEPPASAQAIVNGTSAGHCQEGAGSSSEALSSPDSSEPMGSPNSSDPVSSLNSSDPISTSTSNEPVGSCLTSEAVVASAVVPVQTITGATKSQLVVEHTEDEGERSSNEPVTSPNFIDTVVAPAVVPVKTQKTTKTQLPVEHSEDEGRSSGESLSSFNSSEPMSSGFSSSETVGGSTASEPVDVPVDQFMSRHLTAPDMIPDDNTTGISQSAANSSVSPSSSILPLVTGDRPTNSAMEQLCPYTQSEKGRLCLEIKFDMPQVPSLVLEGKLELSRTEGGTPSREAMIRSSSRESVPVCVDHTMPIHYSATTAQATVGISQSGAVSTDCYSTTTSHSEAITPTFSLDQTPASNDVETQVSGQITETEAEIGLVSPSEAVRRSSLHVPLNSSSMTEISASPEDQSMRSPLTAPSVAPAETPTMNHPGPVTFIFKPNITIQPVAATSTAGPAITSGHIPDSNKDKNIQPREAKVNPETQPDMGRVSPQETVRGHPPSVPLNSSLIRLFDQYWSTSEPGLLTSEPGELPSVVPAEPTTGIANNLLPATSIASPGQTISGAVTLVSQPNIKIQPVSATAIAGPAITNGSPLDSSDGENTLQRGPHVNPDTQPDMERVSPQETVREHPPSVPVNSSLLRLFDQHWPTSEPGPLTSVPGAPAVVQAGITNNQLPATSLSATAIAGPAITDVNPSDSSDDENSQQRETVTGHPPSVPLSSSLIRLFSWVWSNSEPGPLTSEPGELSAVVPAETTTGITKSQLAATSTASPASTHVQSPVSSEDVKFQPKGAKVNPDTQPDQCPSVPVDNSLISDPASVDQSSPKHLTAPELLPAQTAISGSNQPYTAVPLLPFIRERPETTRPEKVSQPGESPASSQATVNGTSAGCCQERAMSSSEAVSSPDANESTSIPTSSETVSSPSSSEAVGGCDGWSKHEAVMAAEAEPPKTQTTTGITKSQKPEMGHVAFQEKTRPSRRAAPPAVVAPAETITGITKSQLPASSTASPAFAHVQTPGSSEDENMQQRRAKVNPETQPDMGHVSPQENVRRHSPSAPVDKSLISDPAPMDQSMPTHFTAPEVLPAQITAGFTESKLPATSTVIPAPMPAQPPDSKISEKTLLRGKVNTDALSDMRRISPKETSNRHSRSFPVNSSLISDSSSVDQSRSSEPVEPPPVVPAETFSGISRSQLPDTSTASLVFTNGQAPASSKDEKMQPRRTKVNPETQPDMEHVQAQLPHSPRSVPKADHHWNPKEPPGSSDDENIHPIGTEVNPVTQPSVGHVPPQENGIPVNSSLISDPAPMDHSGPKHLTAPEVLPGKTITEITKSKLPATSTASPAPSYGQPLDSRRSEKMLPRGKGNTDIQSDMGHASPQENVSRCSPSIPVNSSFISDPASVDQSKPSHRAAPEVLPAETTAGIAERKLPASSTAIPAPTYGQPLARKRSEKTLLRGKVNTDTQPDMGHVSPHETVRGRSPSVPVDSSLTRDPSSVDQSGSSEPVEPPAVVPAETISAISKSQLPDTSSASLVFTNGQAPASSKDETMQPRTKVNPVTQPDMGHMPPQKSVRGPFPSVPVNSSLISDPVDQSRPKHLSTSEMLPGQSTTEITKSKLPATSTAIPAPTYEQPLASKRSEKSLPRGKGNTVAQPDVEHVPPQENLRGRYPSIPVNSSFISDPSSLDQSRSSEPVEPPALVPAETISGISKSQLPDTSTASLVFTNEQAPASSEDKKMQSSGAKVTPDTRPDMEHVSPQDILGECSPSVLVNSSLVRDPGSVDQSKPSRQVSAEPISKSQLSATSTANPVFAYRQPSGSSEDVSPQENARDRSPSVPMNSSSIIDPAPMDQSRPKHFTAPEVLPAQTITEITKSKLPATSTASPAPSYGQPLARKRSEKTLLREKGNTDTQSDIAHVPPQDTVRGHPPSVSMDSSFFSDPASVDQSKPSRRAAPPAVAPAETITGITKSQLPDTSTASPAFTHGQPTTSRSSEKTLFKRKEKTETQTATGQMSPFEPVRRSSPSVPTNSSLIGESPASSVKQPKPKQQQREKQEVKEVEKQQQEGREVEEQEGKEQEEAEEEQYEEMRIAVQEEEDKRLVEAMKQQQEESSKEEEEEEDQQEVEEEQYEEMRMAVQEEDKRFEEAVKQQQEESSEEGEMEMALVEWEEEVKEEDQQGGLSEEEEEEESSEEGEMEMALDDWEWEGELEKEEVAVKEEDQQRGLSEEEEEFVEEKEEGEMEMTLVVLEEKEEEEKQEEEIELKEEDQQGGLSEEEEEVVEEEEEEEEESSEEGEMEMALQEWEREVEEEDQERGLSEEEEFVETQEEGEMEMALVVLEEEEKQEEYGEQGELEMTVEAEKEVIEKEVQEDEEQVVEKEQRDDSSEEGEIEVALMLGEEGEMDVLVVFNKKEQEDKAEHQEENQQQGMNEEKKEVKVMDEEKKGVKVAVLLELDSDSDSDGEYSVQMAEVKGQSQQREAQEDDQDTCQAEEVSSPRPGSPVFWTAISPIGHSRTIYHSSPTSADHCLSEVKVFSQDSNSPARFQEVNVSPARLQEVNVSPARIQEVGVSSTRRLQRLLEESRQMVSALEGLSLDVTSPSPSSPHSPAQHSRMAQALTNGHHDDSSVQDGSSEARSLNSSRENSFQTRRISSHRSQE